MRDAFNRELRPGDLVVYPTSEGRRIAMRCGRVLAVSEGGIVVRPENGHLRDGHWRDKREGQRKDVAIRRTENTVIV